jgi:Domain of unknown function (DUF222)/HNH endonuclease
VGSLRSALDELRSEVLSELPDVRVEEDFDELQRAAEVLEVERLRRLAEIDRRRLFERDGFLSTAAWLVGRFRMAWGFARELVRTARALEEMPATRNAIDAGEISSSAMHLLARARDTDPDEFRDFEAQLVEAARLHSVNDLKRVVAHWRDAVECGQSEAGPERLRQGRRLHASVTFMGMVRLDGNLDPELGETVLTALRAVQDAERRSADPRDDRTPAQRRADALGEVCRQFLDRVDRPSVGGERPHLTVLLEADALRTDGRGVAELGGGGTVSSKGARRLACDASIARVVMSGSSEPLDVGRRTHVVPPAMRRAVVVRDRHCRFPGCDRPQTWCDAHHVVHWADGGRTSVANLLLMCRRHHRMVHEGGFTLRIQHGQPVFRRPDGAVLEDRAPPRALAS